MPLTFRAHKRAIEVFIVTAHVQGNLEAPLSNKRAAKWTLSDRRNLFGLLKVPRRIPAEEAASIAVAVLKDFQCTCAFIPDPAAPEGVLEGGKYVSVVEDDPGSGRRRQQQAFLEEFTPQELRLIHTKLFGEGL